MTGSLRRIPLKRAVFVQDFIFLREPECTVDFLTSPSSVFISLAWFCHRPPCYRFHRYQPILRKIFFFGTRFPCHARLDSALVFSGCPVPRQALPVM
jgi:hypothetical protein